MATKLEKDLVRESTVKFDDREIMVTITKDQEVSFKLKGMKTGSVSIGIGELYRQLTGNEETEEKPKVSLSISRDQPKSTKKNPMLSLYDLRSQNAISTMDHTTVAKFDGIINNLIDSMK